MYGILSYMIHPAISRTYASTMDGVCMVYECYMCSCKLSPPLENFPVSSFPIHFPHLFALYPNISQETHPNWSLPRRPKSAWRTLRRPRLYPLWELNAHVVQKSSRIDQVDIGFADIGFADIGLSSSCYRKRWEKIEKFFCRCFLWDLMGILRPVGI